MLVVIGCALFAGGGREPIKTRGIVSIGYLPISGENNNSSWSRYTIIDSKDAGVIWGRDERSNNYGNMDGGHMRIAVIYNGITSIGDNEFINNNLSGLVIPSSVSLVGDRIIGYDSKYIIGITLGANLRFSTSNSITQGFFNAYVNNNRSSGTYIWNSRQWIYDIRRDFIFSSENYAYINADNLNVRSGPSSEYKITAVLSKNIRVEIIDKTGNWWKISYGTITGYVNSHYLRN